MLLEKLEPSNATRSASEEGFSKVKLVAFYFTGIVALVATVLFLLKTEDPIDYQPQFGRLEASR